MKLRHLARCVCLSPLVSIIATHAAVSVTTGAGYIPMAKAIVQVCKKTVNAPISESYGGHIGQQLMQIHQGNGVNVIITDRGTLESLKSPVALGATLSLGRTPLVLIWRKGLEIKSPEDLVRNEVTRIAAPDAKAAVYGRAAKAWLSHQNASLQTALGPKWLEVGHVPQVAAYVSRGEVDAGFVNMLASQKNQAQLGGSLPITEGYPPIEMIAVAVKSEENQPDVKAFLSCLQTPETRAVLTRFGIEP